MRLEVLSGLVTCGELNNAGAVKAIGDLRAYFLKGNIQVLSETEATPQSTRWSVRYHCVWDTNGKKEGVKISIETGRDLAGRFFVMPTVSSNNGIATKALAEISRRIQGYLTEAGANKVEYAGLVPVVG